MAAKSLRERILSAQDIRSERVHVPEWDVEVEVRSMTGAQRAAVLKGGTGADGEIDLERLYPILLIETTYDPESGERIFNPADRDALNAKNSGALERIAKVAMRLSGIEPGAEDAAKND